MSATAPAEVALTELVLARLAAEGRAEEPLAQVVLAALEGPDAVDVLVENGALPDAATRTAAAAAPLGAYVTSVTVEGFRGVGRPATLELTPGPGLTLVVGRNGSGKSSFADALEVLFTEESRAGAGAERSHALMPRAAWRIGAGQSQRLARKSSSGLLMESSPN